MSDVLGSALDLASRGMYVFPIDSPELEKCAGIGQGHYPDTCTDRGKHPCVPFTKQATTDPQQIAAWFTGYPRNLGVACGKSGLLVVDEDTPGDLARYAATVGGTIPPTFTVTTGRGSHFYFQAGDHDLGNAEAALKPYGVNVRGRGGYVVGPGSLHATGALYDIALDVPPAPLPSWLLAALKPRQAATEGAVDWSRWDDKPRGLAAVPEVIRGPHDNAGGERHEVLVKYACSLRARDVPLAEAEPLYRLVWQRCEQPPTATSALTWDDARAKLLDVYARYTVTTPRPEVTVLEGDDATEAALNAAAALAREVDREAFRLRAREAARAKVDAEKAATRTLPELARLSDFLATPDEEFTHRVAGLWPTGGRVVLSAPHKSGKTTLTGNLTRCLVDAEPFLDRFDVLAARRVVLLDNELDERMLRRWLRDQGIVNAGAVELIPLRGRLSTFDVLDPATRQRWAEHIGPTDVLLFDCLRPALDALGLSEDKDAGRFLEALDELTTAAGIAETLVVHHMGHNGERSRGDSRILDWPDAIWKLVKDAEDEETETRRVYFTAYGRDVDQAEALLSFDSGTRRLSVAGGSRRDSRAESVLGAVLTFLTENPGATGRAVERAVEGRAEHVRRALRTSVERGVVTVEKVGQAHLHTLTASTVSHRVPDAWTHPPRNRVPASIDADADAIPLEDENTRDADALSRHSWADLLAAKRTPTDPEPRPCDRCAQPNPDYLTRAYCSTCWPAPTQKETANAS